MAPPPTHASSCPGEQGGSCEGPSGDLSPRASRLHAAAQRRFCEGQFVCGAAWGGAACSRVAALRQGHSVRGISHPPRVPLGRGALEKRGVRMGNEERGQGWRRGGVDPSGCRVGVVLF